MSHGLQIAGAARASSSVLPWALSGFRPASPERGFEAELEPGEVRFLRLRTAVELRRIEHLRAEIHLPAVAVADPGFRAREKKEMRKASSGLSSGAVASSER